MEVEIYDGGQILKDILGEDSGDDHDFKPDGSSMEDEDEEFNDFGMEREAKQLLYENKKK